MLGEPAAVGVLARRLASGLWFFVAALTACAATALFQCERK